MRFFMNTDSNASKEKVAGSTQAIGSATATTTNNLNNSNELMAESAEGVAAVTVATGASIDVSKALNSVNIGVCIKDTKKKVLFQNDVSKQLCEDKAGQVCNLNCTEMDKELKGICHTSMKNQLKFKDKFVNAVFHKDGNQVTTFMFPSNQIEVIFQKPEIQALSKREQEVVRMILMGLSNNEIAEKLFISRLTVKTHINNIYKKIPQEIKDLMPRDF